MNFGFGNKKKTDINSDNKIADKSIDQTSNVYEIMTIQDAKHYIQDANNSIESMPSEVQDWLFKQHILVDDEDNDSVYFDESANTYLYRSQELLDKIKESYEYIEHLTLTIKSTVATHESYQTYASKSIIALENQMYHVSREESEEQKNVKNKMKKLHYL